MDYNKTTAFHYAAFRPSLHAQILEECIANNANFYIGLDVGCGTGQSAIALAEYCQTIQGIEPSEAMLTKVIAHPKIAYSLYDCKTIEFPSNTFEIITFAGSLFYGKSQALLDEVVRVSKNEGTIIIYDFEVLLDAVLEQLNVNLQNRKPSTYNHATNFSGLNQQYIHLEKVLNPSFDFNISIVNLTHLLLSDTDNYNVLVQTFVHEELYDTLVKKLYAIFQSDSVIVKAKGYGHVYRVVK